MNVPGGKTVARRRLELAGRLLLIAIGLTAAWFLDQPDVITPGSMIACPFRNLTGLPCPGCGNTRAFHHIVHGELAEAAQDNALAFFILACVVVEIVNGVAGIARGGRPLFFWNKVFELRTPRVIAYSFVAGAFIYAAARMILVLADPAGRAAAIQTSILF